MSEFWETAFVEKQLMWGLAGTASATRAAERFERAGAKRVLIPGIGYGRNALGFLERGMDVTGIEISGTAIALARAELGLAIPIHHGSVEDMPFDDAQYDGIFCFGLLYLLDTAARAKLLHDCYDQLAPGGHMVFVVISKEAPMYGQGTCIGEDRFERLPNLGMFFYDERSVARELGPFGLVEQTEIDEPGPNGSTLPFLYAVCEKLRA